MSTQVANRCVPPKTSPYTVRWPAFMRSIVEIAYQPRMPVNNAMAINAARSLARIPNIKSYPPWRAEEPKCPDARAAARADHNTGKSEHWLRNGNEAVMFFAFRASPEIRDTPIVGRRWTAYSAHGEFRIAVPAQFRPRLGRSARRPWRPRAPAPRPPDTPAGQRTRRRACSGRAARRGSQTGSATQALALLPPRFNSKTAPLHSGAVFVCPDWFWSDRNESARLPHHNRKA